jgi:hypothetical protein
VQGPWWDSSGPRDRALLGSSRVEVGARAPRSRGGRVTISAGIGAAAGFGASGRGSREEVAAGSRGTGGRRRRGAEARVEQRRTGQCVAEARSARVCQPRRPQGRRPQPAARSRARPGGRAGGPRGPEHRGQEPATE